MVDASDWGFYYWYALTLLLFWSLVIYMDDELPLYPLSMYTHQCSSNIWCSVLIYHSLCLLALLSIPVAFGCCYAMNFSLIGLMHMYVNNELLLYPLVCICGWWASTIHSGIYTPLDIYLHQWISNTDVWLDFPWVMCYGLCCFYCSSVHFCWFIMLLFTTSPSLLLCSA